MAREAAAGQQECWQKTKKKVKLYILKLQAAAALVESKSGDGYPIECGGGVWQSWTRTKRQKK